MGQALLLPLLIALITFLSALVRSTFGFGGAIVNMALLTLVIGIQAATPLAALIGLFISVVIVSQSRQEIDFAAAWRMILGAVLGIPLGTLVLKTAPNALIVGVLGLLLIAFGVYSLMTPDLPRIRQSLWAYFFGFLGGFLGGAYNINGPPAVLYGSLRRWPPPVFRSTLQGYFLPTFLMVVVSHGVGGLWQASTFRYFGLALLPVLAGIMAGRQINYRLDASQFSRYVYMLIIVLGIVLLLRTIG